MKRFLVREANTGIKWGEVDEATALQWQNWGYEVKVLYEKELPVKIDPTSEAEFHKRIACLLSKRDQGLIMGAFRDVLREQEDRINKTALKTWNVFNEEGNLRGTVRAINLGQARKRASEKYHNWKRVEEA